jgi:hypothetical protein
MTTYALATPDDDATLRALLRDNPMAGWVTMAMEREPSFFAGSNLFGRDWAIIALHGDTPVGMYACSEQPVHLNGAPAELGYLGALRIQQRYRNRMRILREGFASVRVWSHACGPGLWYTAIASENLVACRVLEANLRGMPRYRPVNELVTLAVTKARERRHGLWRPARTEEMDRLCAFHNRQASRFQFAPVLSPELAYKTGASFFVHERQGELVACMALWNQQAYKQVVARAYRWPLGMFLPFYNAYARLARRVLLPRPGQALDQASLAFMAVSPSHEGHIVQLVEDALSRCPAEVLTIGLHDRHPWLVLLSRAFRPAVYKTRIYAVCFEDTIPLDGRPAQPEVALL